MRSPSPLCPPFLWIWLSVLPAAGLRGNKARRAGRGKPLGPCAGRVPPKPRAGQRAPAVINVAVTTPLLGIFLSADGNTALGKARAALEALIAHFLKQFT